jgi:uncharacterized protein YciI
MLRKSHYLRATLMLIIMLSAITGSAQNSLYFIFLNSNPNPAELSEGDLSAATEGHLENIDRLYKEGDLLLAGPFDKSGGVFVLKANSMQAAQDLLATDPSIKADRFIVETMEMEIEKGWICEQVKPHEMIKLNMLRYTPKEGNTKAVPYGEHYGYVQNDNVLFSTAIKNGDAIEYVIILPQGVDANDFTSKDPLVSSGTYETNVKAWWITDQAFCGDKSKKIN